MGSGRYMGLGQVIIGVAMMASGHPEIGAMMIIGGFATFIAATLVDEPEVIDYGQKVTQNTRSTQQTLPLVYGEVRIGSNEVFIETGGSDNKWLYIVDNLAEGECEGIAQVDGQDQIWLDDIIISEFPTSIRSYWFHYGTSTQTYDTNVHDVNSQWVENKIHVCYMVWKLKADTDYFMRKPSRVIQLKGLKVYDFRTYTTAYSSNPVLCLYDYMTNTRYGRGIPSYRFDIGVGGTWQAAANYCDSKGWSFDHAFTTQAGSNAIIDMICKHFRGNLVYSGNKIYLKYADLNEESIAGYISDEHIALQPDGIRAQISMRESSRFDVPDGLKVKFVNKDKEYSVDDVPIGERVGYIETFELLGCTNFQQAMDLGISELEKRRYPRTVSGLFRDDIIAYDPHDVVSLTSDALSISDQLLRVETASYRPSDNLVEMSFRWEHIDFYDDDYDSQIDDIYQCTLPSAKDPPPNVSLFQITESQYFYRLRTFTRLSITFDEPSDYAWYSHCEVWISYDGGINYRYLYDVNTDFFIDPVQEGLTYSIKLRPVSVFGVKRSLATSSSNSLTVQGKTSNPTSLDHLDIIAGTDSVNLYSDKVTDPDVELYEFRLNHWTGGIFLAAVRNPNYSLKSIKPGSHIFYANSLSNNGIYGAIPVSASAVFVDPPRNWTVQAQFSGEYADGSFQNAEQYIYLSGEFVRGLHGGGVPGQGLQFISRTGGVTFIDAGVSGEAGVVFRDRVDEGTSLNARYTSPVYDLGSKQNYLAYILADITVLGAGTAWEDVFISGECWTWEELNVRRPWYQIFEMEEAPKVRMTLRWGDTSGELVNEAPRMEILSTMVNGRFFQLQIDIEDPSYGVYAMVGDYTIKLCS